MFDSCVMGGVWVGVGCTGEFLPCVCLIVWVLLFEIFFVEFPLPLLLLLGVVPGWEGGGITSDDVLFLRSLFELFV